MARCIEIIKKIDQFKDIPEEQLNRLIDEVQNFQKAELAAGRDPSTGFPTFFADKKLELAERRRVAAENLVKTSRNHDIATSAVFKDDGGEGIMAILGGTTRKAPGLGVDIDMQAKGVKSHLESMLVQGLRDSKLWKVVSKNQLTREIMMELHEIRSGGQRGISKSVEARKIAEVIHKVQDESIKILQASGSGVRRLEGYIMRQSHDALKVAKSFDDWATFIHNKLDPERTFGEAAGNTDEEFAILRDIWKTIGDDDQAAGLGRILSDDLNTIKDPLKLEKRVRKARALHFKDGSKFYEYNQEFGTKDLMESLTASIGATSRNAALMSKLGSNPEAGLKKLISKTQATLKERGDVKGLERLNKRIENKSIDHLFKQVSGETLRPGKNMIAGFTRNAIAIERMRLLGRSLLTQIADTSAAAVTLRSHSGENILSSHARVISQFFKTIPDAEGRRFFGDRMGIIIDDWMGATWNRFESQNVGPGAISKAQTLFFRLNGQTFQANQGRTSMAKIFSGDMAQQSAKGFGELSPRYQTNLKQMGVVADEWDIMRQGLDEFRGQKFMTPEAINDLPDSVFKQGAATRKTSVSKFRQQVLTKTKGYFDTAVGDAIPISGAREEAAFLRGMTESEGWGAVARFAKQFKTIPLALNRVYNRSVLMDPHGSANSMKEMFDLKNLRDFKSRGDMQNFTGFILSSTIMGYMALSAKELSKGKEPPDPHSFKTFSRSMQQGGGVGLWTDFIFAEYDKSYRSLSADMLGPVAGSLNTAAEIFAAARTKAFSDEKVDKLGAKTLKAAMGHLPGQNLFWTDMAVKYLFMNEVNEHIDPGFARRQQKRVKQDTGFIDILGFGELGNPTKRAGQ